METRLQELKDNCNLFAEQVIPEIDNLCNEMDYINGSRFSYMRDRLSLFIDELNTFEITPNN